MNGCSHLLRTADAETIANNRKLLARYEHLMDQCPSREVETPVQATWRRKLEADVAHLRRLIATTPGGPVFPDGEDHASPYVHQPVSLL